IDAIGEMRSVAVRVNWSDDVRALVSCAADAGDVSGHRDVDGFAALKCRDVIQLPATQDCFRKPVTLPEARQFVNHARNKAMTNVPVRVSIVRMRTLPYYASNEGNSGLWTAWVVAWAGRKSWFAN